MNRLGARDYCGRFVSCLLFNKDDRIVSRENLPTPRARLKRLLCLYI